MNKYHSKKIEYDGILFHSLKEGRYYVYLKELQKKNLIWNLQLQPRFDFKIDNKLIFFYKADFKYSDNIGEHIVDVKGFCTPIFNLKKKIIEANYGIKIEII